MSIFGGLLLIAAIALFFVQRHYRLKLRSLKLATPSTTAISISSNSRWHRKLAVATYGNM